MKDVINNFQESRVLVTGGTGSIGSEIVRELLNRGTKHVTVFSRDDSKQYYLQQELEEFGNVQFIIGDIRDRESLMRALNQKIDMVIHAAALKHVLICEQNPNEAIKTNILGTQNVIDLAQQFDIKSVVTISTDKSVYPSSTMGASKFVAERLTIDGNVNSQTKCSCVRFGNVLGSRGSVIPSMLNSIKSKNQIWISDPKVTRFAIPIRDAAALVLDSIEIMTGGEIFVLKMKAFTLKQLTNVFEQLFSGLEISVNGLIQAEKLHEDLISKDELTRLWETKELYLIAPPFDDWKPHNDFSKSNVNIYNSFEASKLPDKLLLDEINTSRKFIGI